MTELQGLRYFLGMVILCQFDDDKISLLGLDNRLGFNTNTFMFFWLIINEFFFCFIKEK